MTESTWQGPFSHYMAEGCTGGRSPGPCQVREAVPPMQPSAGEKKPLVNLAGSCILYHTGSWVSRVGLEMQEAR